MQPMEALHQEAFCRVHVTPPSAVVMMPPWLPRAWVELRPRTLAQNGPPPLKLAAEMSVGGPETIMGGWKTSRRAGAAVEQGGRRPRTSIHIWGGV